MQESLRRQRECLLEACLAEAIDLSTLQRKDGELHRRQEDAWAQQREIAAQGQRLVGVHALAESINAICARLRIRLEQATFEQRRQLIELLVDRVVVTNGVVEVRYVIPTTEASTHTYFYHLRTGYLDPEALAIPGDGGVDGRERGREIPRIIGRNGGLAARADRSGLPGDADVEPDVSQAPVLEGVADTPKPTLLATLGPLAPELGPSVRGIGDTGPSIDAHDEIEMARHCPLEELLTGKAAIGQNDRAAAGGKAARTTASASSSS